MALLAVFGVLPVSAQPPADILIQGQLTNAQGAAIPGLRQYRVRFFDAATDGLQLGTNVTGFTLVGAEGLFSFSVAPPAVALTTPELWYELAVDSTPIPNGVDSNDVFAERIRVFSVPFALVASEALRVDAEGVGGGLITGPEFDALSGVTGNIQTQLDTKAAQTAVDDALAQKADAAAVYTKTEVDTALAEKPDIDAVYTKEEVDARVLAWEVVNTSPVQAQPNRGYIVNTTFNEGVVTLPPNASLSVGDIIRVTGAGAGGWRIAQNDDQRILVRPLGQPSFQDNWTARESNRAWRGVASSADGTRLAAVVRGGQIYTSTDSGVTWTPRDSSRLWYSIASSADGTRLVASVENGQIYTSSDSGATWTPRDSVRDWGPVCSSRDGVRLAAVTNTGQIYTSDDIGATWVARESNRQWRTVACSGDGQTILAAGGSVPPRISYNGGVTWVAPSLAVNTYSAAAVSEDGSVMAVASFSSSNFYVSVDRGNTWAQRPGLGIVSALAMSADGNIIWASGPFSTNAIYVSTNSGASFQTRFVALNWQGIACSADGRRVVATADLNRVYTMTATRTETQTTLGSAGSLAGVANTAVELQYLGNGNFLPLSVSGSLGVK